SESVCPRYSVGEGTEQSLQVTWGLVAGRRDLGHGAPVTSWIGVERARPAPEPDGRRSPHQRRGGSQRLPRSFSIFSIFSGASLVASSSSRLSRSCSSSGVAMSSPLISSVDVD